MKLNKIHHIAVICSDYEKSKHLYTDVLGMKIMVCRWNCMKNKNSV